MNIERIEELIEIARNSGAGEVGIELDGFRVVIRKPAPLLRPSAVLAAEAASEAEPAPRDAEPEETAAPAPGTLLTATMVGIFRHAPQALKEGDRVEAGQVVGSIEVMKLANEVVSGSDGIVQRVLVEDGQPVEYGQPLFELGPALEAAE